jgi:PAS domain S-box-containing protein
MTGRSRDTSASLWIQTGSFTVEHRVPSPDGSVRWIHARGRSQFEGEGEQHHAVRSLGTMRDITHRKQAEAERQRMQNELLQQAQELRQANERLRDSEEGLRVALAASGAALWVIDYANGGAESFDARACELAGLDPTVCSWPPGTFCGLLHPDDRPALQAGFESARAGGSPRLIEYRIVRTGGETRWLQGTGALQRDAGGAPMRFIGVSTDITERKRFDAQRELLVRELNHRVKNTIAIVQSIVDQTARASGSVQAFQETFRARLHALASAHEMLMSEGWQSVPLASLAERTLAPHLHAASAERVRIEGPPLRVAAHAAVSVSMVLHELATNAAKYGALANATGRIALGWRIVPAPTSSRVEITWVESGGPPVSPPRRRGFGSRLVSSLAIELSGDASLSYPPEGVVCRLSVPLGEKIQLG